MSIFSRVRTQIDCAQAVVSLSERSRVGASVRAMLGDFVLEIKFPTFPPKIEGGSDFLTRNEATKTKQSNLISQRAPNEGVLLRP